MRDIKKKHHKNVIIGHININSLKNKFFELTDILYDKVPDILFLSETKLDDTFNQCYFNVPGYRLFRNDRNIHGGGVLCFVKSTLPARRRPDLEFENPIESIVLDIVFNDRRWAVIGMYNPPSVKNETFNTLCVKSFDRITSMFDNSILIGDLNFDLNDPQKGKTLIDICDIFDLTNMIKSDTCFTKNGRRCEVELKFTVHYSLFGPNSEL